MKCDLGRKLKRHRDIDELELEISRFGIGVGNCDGNEALPLCMKLKMELCTQSKGQEDTEELEALLMRIKISI